MNTETKNNDVNNWMNVFEHAVERLCGRLANLQISLYAFVEPV